MGGEREERGGRRWGRGGVGEGRGGGGNSYTCTSTLYTMVH